MTKLPKPKDLTNSYTAKYDAWNRLVSLKAGSDDVQLNLYDGLHRRIMRITDTDDDGVLDDIKRFYYNEQWQCLEEQDYAGNLQRQYVWHPYYIDALAVSYNSSGDKHFYCHDANFNVTAAMDSNGDVVERYHYAPYGAVTFLNPDFTTRSASSIENEFLYTGRRLDPESALQYSRYRYYHPQLGRWLTRDPIGYEGDSFSLYEYVGGMPTIFEDPTGEFKWPKWKLPTPKWPKWWPWGGDDDEKKDDNKCPAPEDPCKAEQDAVDRIKRSIRKLEGELNKWKGFPDLRRQIENALRAERMALRNAEAALKACQEKQKKKEK